eukprot:s1944_g11.t1
MFLADDLDEALILPDDELMLKIGWTKRGKMEVELEDVEETALPKKMKTMLRKSMAENSKVQETLAVAVSEVFSPPRIAKEAKAQKLKTGKSYDLLTGYDLRLKKDLAKMWRELEDDDPLLTCCSPPCTPFSILQELNFPKMDEEKVVMMVGEGLQHFQTSVCAVGNIGGERFSCLSTRICQGHGMKRKPESL